ncbi:MAG: ATP-dependent zinc metalloprotease FtsH [Anaeroplasma sp.]|uniref:ATP-dependent zinc metalloprotease FtsH n=1 Tax=Anaeroplasma sp. TaxID=1872523 RepID=UPI002A91440F|nr:ATP-dependent zinc metalloprotease FtsH [Anaeroplasma sp.]MDY5983330.1 ATP-dependent zinc metalloprotease FtsH [Anaeroplasma sp.]
MQNNNNKEPQEKKSRRKFDIVFILVVIILIIAIFFLIRGFTTKNPENLDYQTFVTALKNGKVTDTISATPVGGDNYLMYGLSGTYINAEGNKVSFSINVTSTILEELIKDNAGYKFYIVPASNNYWLSILVSFLPYIIMGVIFFFLFRGIMKSQGGAGGAFDFAKSTAKLSKGKSVTFKDVAGCDEEKEEMVEIVDFLKNPRKYNEIGARVPKGVILVGPPGTGKTLLAKAVAGEAGVPFFSISGSDFVEMFVGVGASRVRDMFKTAKENAPCIIFIDEIDAVGRQRGAGLGGGHDEREQTLNQLLVEMDGFNGNTGIIIMAATNRPDVLDPALLRPGRFDRQITISNPDVRGREAILAVHARNKHLSPDVRLGDVAQRTPGFSGADLENLLNEAALLAARDNRKVITPRDIDEATDRVMMGPAKKSKKYTEKERKLVAYHEAGHAVIGIKLENASQVQKITIVPRGQAGGYNLMMPKEETYFHTKTQMLETITGFLGGRVAEELVFNEVSTGASNDFQNATNIARSMVTQYGMSELGPVQYEQQGGSVFLGRDYLKEKNFSDQVALEIDREQRRIIEECYERAKDVISSNMELLTNIAEYLLKVETINKRDIDEIVATGHLAWCDEKYAPGVSPKEVTPNEEVKEESASVEDSIETEEVNIDDHIVLAPKEDNDGE